MTTTKELERDCLLSAVPLGRSVSTSVFLWATRAERFLQRTVVGRVFLLLCALSTPVDFGLDVKMGFTLASLGERTFAVLLFGFLYLSLRLQLLLFLATTARPLVDKAKKMKRKRALRAASCCLAWEIPEFTVRAAAVSYLPCGLQWMTRKKPLLCLEVVYAPLVLLLGPFIVVYGSILSAISVFSKTHFYRLPGHEQVRRVRAVLISSVSTSFQAVPQLAIQATVYAVGTVQLNAYGRQIVIASMSFSILSLLRSVLTIMASYHKILFTLKRINRDIDETTFNIILHECGDLATSGDSVRMRFDSADDDDDRRDDDDDDFENGLSLRKLREFTLEPPNPADPHNISFRRDDDHHDTNAFEKKKEGPPRRDDDDDDRDDKGPRHAGSRHLYEDDSKHDEKKRSEEAFVDIIIDPSATAFDQQRETVPPSTADHDDDDDVLAL